MTVITTPKAPVDLTSFAGHWRNTADEAQWLQELSLFARDGGWWMTGRARGDGALTEMAVTSYTDNMGGLAFEVVLELADRRVVLAANTQIELIVITAFHRHGPGHHAQNCVQREFFYRVEEGG